MSIAESSYFPVLPDVMLAPISYKVFTIAAGALSMALLTFALASLIGRGARFFLAAPNQAGLRLPPGIPAQWVVDCKGVGDGEKALVYLGRYLYRGVIQEKDILSCDNGQVRFRYRDGKTGKRMTRSVSGAAFLRLILQHVLPKGFRRARNFGFLHPNSKGLIALLQVVLRVIPGTSLTWMKPRPPLLCKCCGAPMRIVRR